MENGKGNNPAHKTAKKLYRDYKNFDMDSFKMTYKALTGVLPVTTMMLI